MRLITEQTEARHGTLENGEETDMTDAVIYNFTELMFPWLLNTGLHSVAAVVNELVNHVPEPGSSIATIWTFNISSQLLHSPPWSIFVDVDVVQWHVDVDFTSFKARSD